MFDRKMLVEVLKRSVDEKNDSAILTTKEVEAVLLAYFSVVREPPTCCWDCPKKPACTEVPDLCTQLLAPHRMARMD